MAGFFFELLVLLIFLKTVTGENSYVNITFLDNAVKKGAVCLDGSAPAYSYLEGYGDGASNWIIYMQGGGWCNSTQDCYTRSRGIYGSTFYYRSRQILFSGILDNDEKFNPDFNNWHKVFVIYCDGSSFMSDVEQVNHETNLTYRGARIFSVVVEEMLSKGMGSAKNAILTGGSAGGLTTLLYCDKFHSFFPNTSRVKCISDSGFFIHAKDQPGVEWRQKRFAGVVATHKLAGSLPQSCTSKMDPNLCLFPEYFVEEIQTPLFIIESAFDEFQIEQNLIPALGSNWTNCTKNLTMCNSTQLGIMKDFRTAFIMTLEKLGQSSSRGMFVHSCYLHGHLLNEKTFSNNVLANKTIGQAVGDWYYDRSPFKEMDTRNEFPRNCSST